jgi:hypothetical protein
MGIWTDTLPIKVLPQKRRNRGIRITIFCTLFRKGSDMGEAPRRTGVFNHSCNKRLYCHSWHLPEKAEKPSERDQILPVMRDDGDQWSAIPCGQVGLVKFRYHCARDIIIPLYPKQPTLQSTQAAVDEILSPSFPGVMEKVIVGVPEYHRTAVEGRTL